jgi:hypothetical protein
MQPRMRLPATKPTAANGTVTMARSQPTPEEIEADNLAIWLIRNPEAAAAPDRWLDPDKRERPYPPGTTCRGTQAEAEADA